jgi:hypothetical protein
VALPNSNVNKVLAFLLRMRLVPMRSLLQRLHASNSTTAVRAFRRAVQTRSLSSSSPPSSSSPSSSSSSSSTSATPTTTAEAVVSASAAALSTPSHPSSAASEPAEGAKVPPVRELAFSPSFLLLSLFPHSLLRSFAPSSSPFHFIFASLRSPALRPFPLLLNTHTHRHTHVHTLPRRL